MTSPVRKPERPRYGRILHLLPRTKPRGVTPLTHQTRLCVACDHFQKSTPDCGHRCPLRDTGPAPLRADASDWPASAPFPPFVASEIEEMGISAQLTLSRYRTERRPSTKEQVITSLRLLLFSERGTEIYNWDIGTRVIGVCPRLCTAVYFFNEVRDQNSINSHSNRSGQQLIRGAIQGVQHHSLRIREVHSWLKIGLERSRF